jgi:hypothetical protein
MDADDRIIARYGLRRYIGQVSSVMRPAAWSVQLMTL